MWKFLYFIQIQRGLLPVHHHAFLSATPTTLTPSTRYNEGCSTRDLDTWFVPGREWPPHAI